MSEIQLGDKVKCRHTGFVGIVVAKTEFINGCIQFGVLPKMKKKDTYPDEIAIDEDSLEVIAKKKKVVKKKKPLGGRARPSPSMRGF